MSFRSLIADLVLGGNLANAYSLTGAITLGDPSAGHIVIDGATDTFLIYSAAHTLALSIAPAAGVDAYGNAFPAGVALFSAGVLVGQWNGPTWTIGQSGASQISAATSAGNTQLTLPSGNANILTSAFLENLLTMGGTAGYDELDLASSQDSTNKEQWFLTLRSASKDGTQRGQLLLRLAHPASIGTVSILLCDFAGGHLVGNVTAVQPGTGTAAVAPVAETWHTVPAASISGLWTTVGVNQPLRYRLEGVGGGLVRLSGELLTTGAGPWPANATILMLGAGYRPAQSTPFVTRSDIAVTAGQCTVNILNTGSVQNGQTFTAAGQRLFFDGIAFPVD